MGQIALGILLIAVLSAITYVMYKKRTRERPEIESATKKTVESTLRVIKNEVADLTKEDEMLFTSDINYEAIVRNKRRTDENLRLSVYGVKSAVAFVTALLKNILIKEFPTRESLLELMDFDAPMYLDSEIKFIILVQRLREKGIEDIIGFLNDKYDLTQERVIRYEQFEGVTLKEFDDMLLDRMFREQVVEKSADEQLLSYSDILDALAVFFFARYRGPGPITTLSSLKCDGYNFGTSGSIRYELDGKFDAPYKTTNSTWVQIEGNWVLFSFIDFYNVKEMRRVVNSMMSWGTAPPMTEKVPFKVVDGWDGSRRTAIRPPSGESWAIFIRNFTLSSYTMEELLKKDYAKNWELPAMLNYFLMRAEQTTAYTGGMNTGKTTMMKANVRYIEHKNIRVLEMAFELALREIYPYKNIETVKSTDYVSSSQLQDLLKKSDGYVSMVGEVAEDIVAARMIQFCLVASAFTIFSHHAVDDTGLVHSLRNSLVASKEYSDIGIAESLVLDAIKNNVHLTFTSNRKRVIEYISQIVKENEITPYPEISELLERARNAFQRKDVAALSEALVAQTLLQREYYTRRTDRVKFSSRKIVVYNERAGVYEPNEWYTPEAMKSIMGKLDDTDREKFIAFYRQYWGG